MLILDALFLSIIVSQNGFTPSFGGQTMDCPYCGSSEVDYVGIDDGGCAYGVSAVDTWHCLDCDIDFEDCGYDLRNIQEDENFQAGREENPQ
jgi:hypothetical protein